MHKALFVIALILSSLIPGACTSEPAADAERPLTRADSVELGLIDLSLYVDTAWAAVNTYDLDGNRVGH